MPTVKHFALLSSVLVLPGLPACASSETDGEAVGRHAEAIVYGNDDRVDPHQAPEPFAQLARNSAVALISPERLRAQDDGRYALDAPRLGDAFSLCAGERFADQPTAANCSGVLVDDDLVATSAHCLAAGADGSGDCTQNRYVFGYHVPDSAEPIVLRADQIYECTRVLARVASSPDAMCHFDLALLRLDRAVQAPLAPVSIRGDPVATGESLAVIGFTAGLPVKVDRGARVIDARLAQGDFFTLNSDTFSVSSGSGVFDTQGQLVGLFSRGRRDFDSVGTCQRVHREDETTATAFEQATRVEVLVEVLRAVARGSIVRACDSDPPCSLRSCMNSNEGRDASETAGSFAIDMRGDSSCSTVSVGSRVGARWTWLQALVIGLGLRRLGRRPFCKTRAR